MWASQVTGGDSEGLNNGCIVNEDINSGCGTLNRLYSCLHQDVRARRMLDRVDILSWLLALAEKYVITEPRLPRGGNRRKKRVAFAPSPRYCNSMLLTRRKKSFVAVLPFRVVLCEETEVGSC